MNARVHNFDRSFGFIINDISRLLRREFDRRVRGMGLTRAQWILLSHLARQPGASQSELAESLQQEKITISRQVARLEKSGWIERSDHTADRRAYSLQLTPKAQQIMTRLLVVAEQLRVDAMAGLAPQRREALIDDLLFVKTNLLHMDAGAS